MVMVPRQVPDVQLFAGLFNCSSTVTVDVLAAVPLDTLLHTILP